MVEQLLFVRTVPVPKSFTVPYRHVWLIYLNIDKGTHLRLLLQKILYVDDDFRI